MLAHLPENRDAPQAIFFVKGLSVASLDKGKRLWDAGTLPAAVGAGNRLTSSSG